MSSKFETDGSHTVRAPATQEGLLVLDKWNVQFQPETYDLGEFECLDCGATFETRTEAEEHIEETV